MSKIWFVTGASSGFGKEITKKALSNNDKVVATFRKQTEVDDFNKRNNPNGLGIKLDVTDQNSIKLGVKNALHTFGSVDYLVNNAGFGVLGTIEESTNSDIRKQFDVNFFGLVDVTKAILPTMRKNKSGHIFNISSICGLVSDVNTGYYCASKFAVEAVSEALAQEVKHLGIQITAIEPGPFKTSFVEKSNLHSIEPKILDYQKFHDGMKEEVENFFEGDHVGDPEKLASIITSLAGKKSAPRNLILGESAYDWFFEKNDSFVENVKKWEKTTKSTALNTKLDLSKIANG